MKECEGDGCQRKSEAVEKESRTSEGQTDMTDHRWSGEWTRRVKISKEESPGSKRSTYGYILTYSRL